jgi:hypothetical protein
VREIPRPERRGAHHQPDSTPAASTISTDDNRKETTCRMRILPSWRASLPAEMRPMTARQAQTQSGRIGAGLSVQLRDDRGDPTATGVHLCARCRTPLTASDDPATVEQVLNSHREVCPGPGTLPEAAAA